MKKTFFSCFLIFTTIFVSGQTISYGIKAGFNLSTLSPPHPAFGSSALIEGFKAGGVIDFGFQNFSIQAGIFYSTKGQKLLIQYAQLDPNDLIITATDKLTLNYIEIPANFIYKINISPGCSLHLGGGPYIGYGIAEVYVQENASSTGINYSSSRKFGYNNPDYGLNAIAGIEIINNYTVDVGYGLGLANIGNSEYPEHNRVISFSVGYMFK